MGSSDERGTPLERVEVLVADLLALDRVLREVPQNLLISEAESVNRLMQAIPMDAFRAEHSDSPASPEEDTTRA
jgi:hypothetical protein